MIAAAVDAPYRDVEHALRSAYAAQLGVVCKTSAPSLGRGDAVDPYERIAQGALTVQFVQRHLMERERDLIEALYTVRAPQLIAQKDLACKLTGFRVWEAMGEIPARWYIVDVVRKWAGMLPDHDDDYWADRLGRAPNTLRRWRMGLKNGPGAEDILDEWHDGAVLRLEALMEDMGLCGRV